MKNSSEIRRANEEELVFLAKRRIQTLPLLREIYDDDFLYYLAKQKRDLDNELLHWLVSTNNFHHSIATRFFEEIEQMLHLLQPICDFNLLKEKMRQWKTESFESIITELEFAAEYLQKGYEIKLEPNLPNNRKGDFLAIKNSQTIFFEIKTIFQETAKEDQYVINELVDRFDRIEQPYFFNIDIKKGCKRRHIVGITKNIKNKLKKINDNSKLPISFTLNDDNQELIKVKIISKNPTGTKGGIGGFVFGGGIKGDWKDLRQKIVAGISQLHPKHAGVIVIKPHGLQTLEYDMENALWGDLAVYITRTARPFRRRNGIFALKKNKRLSAVVFYKKEIDGPEFFRKKIVYHNPFANNKLPLSLFDGINCIQYRPKFKPTFLAKK